MPSTPPETARRSLHALPPGTVLHDYVIDSELGSGGFSVVYLARHRLNYDWLFAIKEYLPRELAVRDAVGASVHPVNTEVEDAFADGLRRFRDEAEQLRRFRNERYIVSCLNYFKANGTAYLVMDYDDGLPLSEFLRQREAAGQPFTEADLRAVIEPLLEGLEVVHRAGVLHRDIKPGNIFVRRPDDITGRPAQPVLIDFGAAKQNYLSRHSRSQAPYTPGYAAYEQVSSMGEIGPWTDIYALGALMWRMVAGGCTGDARLHMAGDSMGGTVWSPTPRAVEKRSYALHSRGADPMVPAVELGADRFSPHLLAAIDACLTLIPEHRVRSCQELKLLIEQAVTQRTGSHKETTRNGPVGKPASASAKQSNMQLDVNNDIHGERSAEGTNDFRRFMRTVTARLKRFEWQISALPNAVEHRQQRESPLVTGRKAISWRVPSIRALGITALILAAMSLGATLFLRIPLTPEQVGLRFDARNLLIAAIRQHNSPLNLAGLAYEYVQFDEDPTFDRDDLVPALEADNWLYVSRRVGAGIVRESVLDRFEEGTQVDLEELIRMIEAVDSRSNVRVLAQAQSLSEYEYLTRKLDQEIGDSRKLVDYSGGLGIFVATAVVLSDPIVFFVAGALVIFVLRRGLFSTRRAALWGAGVGALGCASIVSIQEVLLHIAQDFRTLDYSIASVSIGALLGGLSLSLVGAFTSRRLHDEVAARQDASIRVGSICGLSAPILYLIFSQMGLAYDLSGAETLSLVLSTFVVVSLFYLLLDCIKFFSRRKEWTIWMIALGVLYIHSSMNSLFAPLIWIVILEAFLTWIPSAVILEALYRLFEKLNIAIMPRKTLQVVLLCLLGYLTWAISHGDVYTGAW